MSKTLQVQVPDIGDFKDVEIIEVLVKPGDTVAAEDTLITLESDKASMDVPAPAAGTVAELLVKVGDRVSEGTPVLTLQASETAAVAAGPAHAPATATPTAAASPAAGPGGATDRQCDLVVLGADAGSKARKAAVKEEVAEEVAAETESEEEVTEEPDAVRTKIELIKKRLADKGMILEGDSYYNNNQLSLALKKYLEFYKKNPNDPLILEKIALTYFELKKFGSSVNYLSRLPEMPQSQKELFALSLIYSLDITLPENRVKIENELKKYNYSSEEIFYYTQSLSCITDFHICKL